MHKLIIAPAAARDAAAGAFYYHKISTLLGLRFQEELNVIYNKLAEQPQYYSFVSAKSNFRDAKFESFPYVVIFKIINNTVRVTAILSTYRRHTYK